MLAWDIQAEERHECTARGDEGFVKTLQTLQAGPDTAHPLPLAVAAPSPGGATHHHRDGVISAGDRERTMAQFRVCHQKLRFYRPQRPSTYGSRNS